MEKMDDELLGILGDAKELIFLAPPVGELTQVKYVTPSQRCGFGFIVKMNVSGIQRILADGILDKEIACRFADMASLRFRKYRRNLKWNFSEAQAIADSKNEEENGGALANFLLARLENKFRNDGTLKEIMCRDNKQPSARLRRTVEQRLAALEQPGYVPVVTSGGTFPPSQTPQPPIPIIWCGNPASNHEN